MNKVKHIDQQVYNNQQNLLQNFELPTELDMDASVLDQLMLQSDEFKDFNEFQNYHTHSTFE